MLGYNHLTTPRPPSVSEHLIPWLFGESLFPTIRIVTKELARLKRDDNRMAKNRKICNSPVITAMNAAAETEKGYDIPEDETHYYFYSPESNTDVVGDLYLKSGIISSAEMDELAKLIVPTKESQLY